MGKEPVAWQSTHLLTLSIGILICLAVGSIVFFSNRKSVLAPVPHLPSESTAEQLLPGEPLAAELAALQFMDAAFRISDPEQTDAAADSTLIQELVTPELLQELNATPTLATSDQLRSLFAVNSWPDDGFTEYSANMVGSQMHVMFSLNYLSEAPQLRTIALVRQPDGWKVAEIIVINTTPIPHQQIR